MIGIGEGAFVSFLILLLLFFSLYNHISICRKLPWKCSNPDLMAISFLAAMLSLSWHFTLVPIPWVPFSKSPFERLDITETQEIRDSELEDSSVLSEQSAFLSQHTQTNLSMLQMHVTEYLGYTSPPLKILERSLGEDIFVKYLTHTKQQLKLQLVKIVTLLMLITLARGSRFLSAHFVVSRYSKTLPVQCFQCPLSFLDPCTWCEDTCAHPGKK